MSREADHGLSTKEAGNTVQGMLANCKRQDAAKDGLKVSMYKRTRLWRTEN